MKKSLSVFLSFIQLSLFGAANSDALTNPEPDYVLPQPPAMDEQKVAIALECLPERLNEFVKRIDKRTLKNGAYLFVGPPGNGKTIAARAIGQQFYRQRSYFFAGSSLVGDRYINSGKETIQANFKPLVQLAKSAPLFVVIDEFQKLMKKKKNGSHHRGDTVTSLWQVLDEMLDTNNIIVVGTCNKVDGIPKPVESRFDTSRHLYFEQVPRRLYERLLLYYLDHSSIDHIVRSQEDLQAIASVLDCEARAIVPIVNEAENIAFRRDEENPVIKKSDILESFHSYRQRNAKKKESWEKWLKRHERKIQAGSVVVGTASAVAMGAYGLYKHQQYREDDIDRQNRQRKDDLRRQEKFHQEQLTQQRELDQEHQAINADYSVLTPPAFRTEYNQASPEVKAKVDERKKREWGAIGETAYMSGSHARKATQVGAGLGVAGGAAAGAGYFFGCEIL